MSARQLGTRDHLPVGLDEALRLDEIVLRARAYEEDARGAFAAATQEAYGRDTRLFGEWCARRGLEATPASAETLRDYVTWASSRHRISTIRRRVGAIGHLHRALALPDPTKTPKVTLRLRAIAREHGRNGKGRPRQARGLNLDHERAILRAVEPGLDDRLARRPIARAALQDARDLAMLCVARDLMARRGELLALRLDHVRPAPGGAGALVLIARSKTDQEGLGAWGGLHPRTAARLDRWLAAVGITAGLLFRPVLANDAVGEGPLDPECVNGAFRRLARRAGIADGEAFSGHSCRVGAAQDLAAAGIDATRIMHSGRWSSPQMVGRYTQHLDVARSGMAEYHAKVERP